MARKKKIIDEDYESEEWADEDVAREPETILPPIPERPRINLQTITFETDLKTHAVQDTQVMNYVLEAALQSYCAVQTIDDVVKLGLGVATLLEKRRRLCLKPVEAPKEIIGGKGYMFALE